MRSGDEDAAGFELGVVGEAACALRRDSPNAYEAARLDFRVCALAPKCLMPKRSWRHGEILGGPELEFTLGERQSVVGLEEFVSNRADSLRSQNSLADRLTQQPHPTFPRRLHF